MPTELEELVEFLHHGNTQIRQVAAENLLPYTKTEPALFRRKQLEPVRDLKLLVKDYEPIKKNAITMLINLSGDKEVREYLATDDAFIETLLLRMTNPKDPHADLLTMLLANLAKSPTLSRLITLQRSPLSLPATNSHTDASPSTHALDQLLDIFTLSSPLLPSSKRYNPHASYDYLAYVFADLASSSAGSEHLTTPQAYDGLVPLQKLLPFTAVDMPLARRLGVASAVKNAAFGIGAGLHASRLLDDVSSEEGKGLLAGAASTEASEDTAAGVREGDSPKLNLLSYILLPLASGSDQYDDDETDALLEDLQLLDPEVRRDPSPQVLATHLETLLILASTARGRERLRAAGTYYVVRECHKAVGGVENEGGGWQVEGKGGEGGEGGEGDVAMGCERLVQVLQRGEPGEEEDEEAVVVGGGKVKGEIEDGKVEKKEDEDEDDEIVDIV